MKSKVKVIESRTTLELLELTEEWEATSRLLLPLSSPPPPTFTPKPHVGPKNSLVTQKHSRKP